MTAAHRQRLALRPLPIEFRSFKTLVREWFDRARSRGEIARLDERTLRDLGISPSQMAFEAQKPFWRT